MKRVLWFFLLLAACSTPPPGSNQLRISFNTYPAAFDPCKAGDFISSTLICLIYEGLTRSLPGGAVEPALAERCEIAEDQLLYTFHLRSAYWSDGRAITAFDFESSWKKALSPPRINAYLFYPIKNVEKYLKGQLSLDKVGIRALDDRTLQVELESPAPYFYSLTAFPTFFPSRSDNPDITSGPFQIVQKINHSEITLAKSKTFWNQQSSSINEIHISIIPDEMTALQMYERNELDWLGGPLSPLPLDALEKLEGETIQIPSAATTFCTFNTKILPFSNTHLRKAFSYAIDREEISRLLNVQVPHSFLPPSFTAQSISLSNSTLARTYFTAALKEIGKLDRLVLYYKPGQMEKRLAQILQRQWEVALGVRVELVQLDNKSHAYLLHNREYQIALASWIAQFDDPINILERFKDEAHRKNYSGWTHPSYCELVSQRNFSEAEHVLADELPIAPIYHWSCAALCSERIQAIGMTPCGGILFERFRLQNKSKYLISLSSDQMDESLWRCVH